jgi:GNAT superfamily N-acetyltransferase
MITIEFGGHGMAERLAAIVNAAYDTGEVGIWLAGWQRTTPEVYAKLIEAGEIAVASREGKAIGCMRIRRLDEDTAELGMLSVAPEAHGDGVGRALIAFAESAFDVSTMQLELLIPRGAPHPAKVRLHEWYSRLGYQEIGRRDFAEPLLAAPAELVTYGKSLRAAPATDAPPRAPT